MMSKVPFLRAIYAIDYSISDFKSSLFLCDSANSFFELYFLRLKTLIGSFLDVSSPSLIHSFITELNNCCDYQFFGSRITIVGVVLEERKIK